MRVRTTLLTTALLMLTMSAVAQNNLQAVDQFAEENSFGGNQAAGQGNNFGGNQAAGQGNNFGGNQAAGQGNNFNGNQAAGQGNNFNSDAAEDNFSNTQGAGQGNNFGNTNFNNDNSANENAAGSQGNLGNGTNIPVNSEPLPANNIPLNNAPINANTSNAAPINPAPTNQAAGNANIGTNAPSNAVEPAAEAPAAPLPPGPPAEMRFQFDQKGIPSLHSFILKWSNSNANLTSISVLISDTQEVIQTIQIPQDGSIKLIYSEVSEKPGRIKDKFFDFVDYNFDSFGDIRLTKQWPYKPGQKSYFVWLFNEAANQYILHQGISALPSSFVDPKAKRIESFTIGGWGGGEYEKRWYSITSKGKLKLQTVVKQTIRDRGRLTFNREVRQRVKGEMQRICKLVVPTEGKIQRLWGKTSQCSYHMHKHPVH